MSGLSVDGMSRAGRMPSFSTEDSIFVAGHRGMVGSAVFRLLEGQGCRNLIVRTSAELDLTDQVAVRDFFRTHRIDQVILAAARVGGIVANNTYPAEFIRQNLAIQGNVIHEAWQAGVGKLLFLGSSCIYPKFCPQPMKEEHLLTGILEPTNEPYAIAKIAGIKMCEAYNRQYGTDYRAVMPTNLYGPGDNYHLQTSHVIPAIIRKCHLAMLAMDGNLDGIESDEARFGVIPDDIRASLGLSATHDKSAPYVRLWGSGNVRREFLHVDDMAAACLFVMSLNRKVYDEALSVEGDGSGGSAPSFLNVGAGKDCTIREVAELIRELVGFSGETRFDRDKPDGTPRKLLDTSRLQALGWRPKYSLRDGLQDAYRWYCARR